MSCSWRTSSLYQTLRVLTASTILSSKPVLRVLLPLCNRSQHDCISHRPAVARELCHVGENCWRRVRGWACCLKTIPYRVGWSPLLGSGVIAVLSYVKLVRRTEMNVGLLESFKNRPWKGRTAWTTNSSFTRTWHTFCHYSTPPNAGLELQPRTYVTIKTWAWALEKEQAQVLTYRG